MHVRSLPIATLVATILSMALWAAAIHAPAWTVSALPGWPSGVLWLVAGTIWLGGVFADPDREPLRRWQVVGALVLALSVLLAPVWADGQLAARPLIEGLTTRLGHGALPWWLAGLGALSLLLLWRHPMLPPWLPPLYLIACVCWLLLFMVLLGRWADAYLHAIPTLVWWLLVALVPFQMRGDGFYVGLPVWLLSLSIACFRVFAAVLSEPLPLGHVVLLTAALSLPGLLAWIVRMDTVARFDRLRDGARELAQAQAEAATGAQHLHAWQEQLTSQLDSANAQEGADKYTRE